MKKVVFPEEEIVEDADIYSEESRDELVENDEINPVEAGFMKCQKLSSGKFLSMLKNLWFLTGYEEAV